MTTGYDSRLMAAPELDHRDVGLRGSEQLGYLSLSHCPSQLSDLGNFFGCQELFEACDTTNADGVQLVEPVISPFEIGDEAIRLHSVDVVDHREAIWVRDESDCDEPVDVNCLSLSILPHADLWVSDTVNARSKNFAVASLWPIQPYARPVEASDTTKITDFVKSAEIGDVNRSPFFRESGIHVTGCPSGNGGSTIKGPVARFNVRRVRHYGIGLRPLQ